MRGVAASRQRIDFRTTTNKAGDLLQVARLVLVIVNWWSVGKVGEGYSSGLNQRSVPSLSAAQPSTSPLSERIWYQV